MLDTARAAVNIRAARNAAMLAVLLYMGLRVGELTALNVGSITRDRGHQVLEFTAKGDKARRLPMPDPVIEAVEEWLEIRGRHAGPLFSTSTGGRMYQGNVWRIMRRIAKNAGIPAWERLSPHSLRHTCATLALDAGATLRDVQDSLQRLDHLPAGVDIEIRLAS